jgi:hypothetical protein
LHFPRQFLWEFTSAFFLSIHLSRSFWSSTLACFKHSLQHFFSIIHFSNFLLSVYLSIVWALTLEGFSQHLPRIFSEHSPPQLFIWAFTSAGFLSINLSRFFKHLP